MRLTVTMFQTLDGVAQAPGAPQEDPFGGFEHGGWLVPHFDEDTGAFMDETFARAGAFLLGRFTYETFAAHWPKVDGDDMVSTKLNALPKHVASRTLRAEDLDWAGATLLGDDVPARVEELKAGGGDGELQVHGSANLVQTLLRHELVDELRVLTFPVVLGTGKRLFGEGAVPAAARLTESRATSAGTLIAVYALEGRPTYGSYALEDA
jgi:dihydrofolate reductase